MNRTSIIVPALNEEKGLAIVLEKILNIMDDSYEVIIVDDGSTDRTAEIASQFPFRLISHGLNKGKGEALKTGISNAQGANIIWIDADDTYPVELIPQLAEALDSHDIVIGSRVYGRNNIPRFNRLGLWLFRKMISILYGQTPYDPCSGLCGVKKNYLDMMMISSSRFAIEPEICVKAGRMKLKMLDIPIEYQLRTGNTKLPVFKTGFEDVWTIIKFFFWKPSIKDMD